MKRRKTGNEWEFSNQNWIKVLDTIWKRAPNRYGRGKTDYDENHPLVKRLKIKAHELMLIMSFLEDQGLIEYDKPDYNWINLTSKGFDVALQNHSAASIDRTNRISLFLSFAIALFVVTSLLMGIDNLCDRWGVAVVLGGALIYAAYLFGKMR